MKIINLKENFNFLEEYIKLCNNEWGTQKNNDEMNLYIQRKLKQINDNDKVICILGLVHNDLMIGFISLFKNDGDCRNDLTPWYATMYIKEEYRENGFSKILNDAILSEARKLGYQRVYLKTDLINYYEKFGAKYVENLSNGEKLYYIDCILEKNM